MSLVCLIHQLSPVLFVLWFYERINDDEDDDYCCLVGGVNRTGNTSRLFSVVLNIFQAEQFCPVLSERICKQVLVANWKETKNMNS